jgi:hypothetical protein
MSLCSEDDSTNQEMQRVQDNNSITDGSTKRRSTKSIDSPSKRGKRKGKGKPKPKKKKKRNLQIGHLNPILFQTLKLLIDKYNEGTDRIVNVNGFVEECGRMIDSSDRRGQAIGVSAESIGLELHPGQQSTGKKKRFENASGGLSFRFDHLNRGLKSCLLQFREDPDCESLMVTLVIAFALRILTDSHTLVA